MSYQPTRWMERLAERLLPPSNAEHILGDIAECSDSRREYLANLFAILPRAVWCQIRRRCNRGVFVFNALLSAYVLGAIQAWLYNAYLSEPWAWPRLAVPYSIWVVGGMLSTAYGPAAKPTHASNRGLLATIVLALGAAALLGVPVAGVAAALGIVIAVWILVIVLFGMPFIKYGVPGPLSSETITQHARVFQSAIWWRNFRESAAGLLVLGFQIHAFFQWPDPMDRAPKVLLIAGVLFMIGYLNFYARPRSVPENGGRDAVMRFHRAELIRQRDILRAVPLWYLFPFVPGLLMGFVADWRGISSLLGMGLVGAVFTLVGWLNRSGAGLLDKQVKEIDELVDQGLPGKS